MAIALDQDSGRQTGANVASDTFSFASLPTVNDHIVVQVSGWHDSGFTMADVTDNQGHNYLENVEAVSAAGQCSASIYSVKVTASSGTFTVTLDPTGSSGNYIEWVTAEFSGLHATTHLHRTGTNNNSSQTSLAVTASAANTEANCLVLAAISVASGDTACNISAPPTGYTQLAVNQNAAATIGFEAAYKIVSATETSSVTWTFDVQDGAAGALATYVAAAGGAAVTGWGGLHHLPCGVGDPGVSVVPQTLHTIGQGISA